MLTGTDATDTVDHPHTTELVKLNHALHAFRASPNASKVKYCIMVILDPNNRFGLSYPPANQFAYLDVHAQRLATFMADSNYLKINGKPVVCVYDPNGQLDTTKWNQFLSWMPNGGGGGSVFKLNCIRNGQTTTLGLNAQWGYGPNSIPAGSGRLPATAQMTTDIGTWSASATRKLVTQLNLVQNRTTFVPSSQFCDQYTQPQLVWLIANAYYRGSNYGIPIYAWNELAEGGPGIVPVVQEAGSPSPTGSRYLEAIRWTWTHIYPKDFAYEITCATSAESLSAPYPGSGVARGGTWTTSKPGPVGLTGAHDSDEEISANTGDFVEIQHPGALEYGFYATTGPDRGIVTFTADGGSSVDIDLYSPTTTHHVLVWTHVFGDSLTHTIRGTVKGTKNASSSSVQVGLDSFYLRCNPNAFRP